MEVKKGYSFVTTGPTCEWNIADVVEKEFPIWNWRDLVTDEELLFRQTSLLQ